MANITQLHYITKKCKRKRETILQPVSCQTLESRIIPSVGLWRAVGQYVGTLYTLHKPSSPLLGKYSRETCSQPMNGQIHGAFPQCSCGSGAVGGDQACINRGIEYVLWNRCNPWDTFQQLCAVHKLCTCIMGRS